MYSNKVSCLSLTLAESGVCISNAGVALYVCSRKLLQSRQEFVPQTGHLLVQLALLYLPWRQLLVTSKDHAVVVLRRCSLPRQSVSERPRRIGIPELVRNSRFTDFCVIKQLCFSYVYLVRGKMLSFRSNTIYIYRVFHDFRA